MLTIENKGKSEAVRLRKYIIVFEKAFKSQIIYRSAALAGLASTILSFGIQVCLWWALLGTELYDGTSFPDMVLFVLVNSFVSTFTYANISTTIEAAMVDGSIAMELLRPMSYKYYLLATILGKNSYNVLIRVLPVVVIGAVILGMGSGASISIALVLPFLLALVLGILVMFELTYIFGLLAFRIQRCWFLSWYINALTKFFGGTAVPLWFYPAFLQGMSYFLPFRYITFEPINILLGRVTAEQTVFCLLIALAWLLVLNVLSTFMWRNAVRGLTVNGG